MQTLLPKIANNLAEVSVCRIFLICLVGSAYDLMF